MSKKKFKKKFRAEIHQQMQQLSQEPKDDIRGDTALVRIPPEKLDKPLPSVSAAIKKINTQTETKNYSYVKNDIKRIGIIFSIVLTLLIIIYIISIKTNWTIETSNWIAQALHIF